MARPAASKLFINVAGLSLMMSFAPMDVLKAQDTDQDSGGVQSRFTVDVTTLGESNADLDPGADDGEFRLETTLGYELSLSTPVQRLNFGLQGTYAATQSDTATKGTGFERPILTFDYGYDGVRNGLTLSASYRESDVSDLSLDIDDSGSITLYEGEGSRAYGTMALGFDGGRDTPLRYKVDLSANSVRYSGLPGYSLSGDYYNSDTQKVAFGLGADLSPLVTLTFDASYTTYQADNSDETRRESSRATLGADLRLDKITRLSLSTGTSRIETRDLSGQESEIGTVGQIDFVREDKLGDYRLSYERSLSETGGRDTIRAARNRAFSTGDLSASVGLTRGTSGETTWVSAVDFSLERPRSDFDFALNRAISTNNDGDDVTVTRAQAGWSHLVNATGSLALDFSARFTEEALEADTERYDLTLAWRQQLPRDTMLSVGASTRLAREAAEEDARSDQLFLTLSRAFKGGFFMGRP